MTSESVPELIIERQDRMRPSERKVAAAVLAAPTYRPTDLHQQYVTAPPPEGGGFSAA